MPEHACREDRNLVYVRLFLGSSKDDLARDKNEQNHFGIKHAVDQTREKLRLVTAEGAVGNCQLL